jgi:small subunit ribosomal protein S21
LGLHRLHQSEGTSEEAGALDSQRAPFVCLPSHATGAIVIEVRIEESDRLENALKVFKRKVQKAGLLKELRQRRHYLKPSAARQLKSAAARRRKKRDR